MDTLPPRFRQVSKKQFTWEILINKCSFCAQFCLLISYYTHKLGSQIYMIECTPFILHENEIKQNNDILFTIKLILIHRSTVVPIYLPHTHGGV